MYQADSIKVALGIGNGALGIHCVMITLANHFIVLYAQITSRGEKKRNNYQPILHDKVNCLALLFCRELRGTQREYSSKPLKHRIVKRILVFKR